MNTVIKQIKNLIRHMKLVILLCVILFFAGFMYLASDRPAWPNYPIRFRINPNFADTQAGDAAAQIGAIRRAADVWCNEGRSISSRVGFANDYYGRRQVYTFYTIRGNTPVKGSLTNHNNFTLQIIEGRVPGSDIEVIVTHMPQLTLGRDTILFLKNYADKMGVLQGDRGQIDL